MKYYVYKHTFENGIVYFGKGKGNRINVNSRNTYWLNLYKKYGEPKREYLHTNISEKLAFILEQAYIEVNRRLGVKDCNMTIGGEGISGYTHTEETKKCISRTLLGIKKSEKTKLNMSIAQKRTKCTKTVQENREVQACKKVIQFNKNYDIIAEYESTTHASQCTGVNRGNINSVCNGKLKSAGKFYWKYK